MLTVPHFFFLLMQRLLHTTDGGLILLVGLILQECLLKLSISYIIIVSILCKYCINFIYIIVIKLFHDWTSDCGPVEPQSSVSWMMVGRLSKAHHDTRRATLISVRMEEDDGWEVK